MPVKTGIHNDLKLLGFRVALATASLPGMNVLWRIFFAAQQFRKAILAYSLHE